MYHMQGPAIRALVAHIARGCEASVGVLADYCQDMGVPTTFWGAMKGRPDWRPQGREYATSQGRVTLWEWPDWLNELSPDLGELANAYGVATRKWNVPGWHVPTVAVPPRLEAAVGRGLHHLPWWKVLPVGDGRGIWTRRCAGSKSRSRLALWVNLWATWDLAHSY